MAEPFTLNAEEFDGLVARIKEYGEGAEEKVNEVLHGFGAERIAEEAKSLVNTSGRNWKGKKASATAANPFGHNDGNLSVTVASKSAYHYLYFPDDGTTTRKHAGQQHFMQRGAEAAKQDILERCVAALVKD